MGYKEETYDTINNQIRMDDGPVGCVEVDWWDKRDRIKKLADANRVLSRLIESKEAELKELRSAKSEPGLVLAPAMAVQALRAESERRRRADAKILELEQVLQVTRLENTQLVKSNQGLRTQLGYQNADLQARINQIGDLKQQLSASAGCLTENLRLKTNEKRIRGIVGNGPSIS